MIEVLSCFMAGAAIGTLQFAGLWKTVEGLACSRHPFRRIGGSFLLRTGLSLVAFYAIMQSDWSRLAAALLGFLVVREVLIRRLGLAAEGFCHGDRCH